MWQEEADKYSTYWDTADWKVFPLIYIYCFTQCNLIKHNIIYHLPKIYQCRPVPLFTPFTEKRQQSALKQIKTWAKQKLINETWKTQKHLLIHISKQRADSELGWSCKSNEYVYTKFSLMYTPEPVIISLHSVQLLNSHWQQGTLQNKWIKLISKNPSVFQNA